MFKDAKEVKDRIVIILRRRGPSLPVHVAKDIGLSMLFTSAFLSELVSDKAVKMSYMRVGSSPIYFIPEHESLLERYSTFLKSKERDAYSILKEKKFLKDKELEPAIRVALREIKDFAIPFQKDNEIFWRYFTIQEREFNVILTQIQKEELKPEEKIEEIKKEVEERIEIKQESFIVKEPQKIKDEITEIKEEKIKIIEKPTIKIKKVREKSEKPKEKPDFSLKVIKFLEKKEIELLEEKEAAKKEFEGTGRINSDLGKIDLIIIGKDKKKITEDDLIIAIQKGSYARKLVLFVTTGAIDKKAEEFFSQHQGIIKFLKI